MSALTGLVPSSRQADAALPLSKPNAKENAAWTDQDVVALLDILIRNMASAGDGGNFKMSVFNSASAELNKVITRGGHKTGKSCQNKYKSVRLLWLFYSFLLICFILQLRKTLEAILHIKYQASGFTWDDERGADIDIASDAAWTTYVKQHPGAKPFRNKGWVHLAQMEQLAPSKARGCNVFRAPQAVAEDHDTVLDRDDTPPPLRDLRAEGLGSPSWDIEKDGFSLPGEDEEHDKDGSSVHLTFLRSHHHADYYLVSHSTSNTCLEQPQA